MWLSKSISRNMKQNITIWRFLCGLLIDTQSTGINGVSLAHYISSTSHVTYLFVVFLETDIDKERLRKVSEESP